MFNPSGAFRMAAVAEIVYLHYRLPVIVEALRADMNTVARIVVNTVDGICDIDPKSPIDLTEEPQWVRFTPKDEKPITIRYSELAALQSS